MAVPEPDAIREADYFAERLEDEQMPLAEIAQVMEIEVGAVKSRLQRARASMKEVLAAYAPGAGERS